MIATLLLAAGSSRRFGADKRLHPLPSGLPLALATLRCYLPFGPVLVVVRGDDDPLRSAVVDLIEKLQTPSHVSCVNATDHALGMGHSLAAGAKNLIADNWREPFLVALADMPHVRPETLTQILSAPAGDLVQPRFQGRGGHPVRFPADVLNAMTTLNGDAGARSILQANRDRLTHLDVDDPGVINDIDTPADLGSEH